MGFEAGDGALAVRAGGGWILKPLCPVEDDTASGVAVRAGAGWVVSAAIAPQEEDEAGFAVRDAAGGCVLLAPGCPEEGGGSGDFEADPLCLPCNRLAYELHETYTVTLSGFPAICTVQNFNGVWTLTWTENCLWTFDITEWHRVTLSRDAGGLWQVAWSVNASGGAYGIFTGAGADGCDPTAYLYAHFSCYNPFGCFGLCDAVAGASVIVTP